MLDELNNEPIAENPPALAPDVTSETQNASVTQQEETLDPVVVTPTAPPVAEPKVEDSAQKRISELNKEAMNHRIKANENKKLLDEANLQVEALKKALEERNAEVEKNRALLQTEVQRIASEKDAEIAAQRKQAEAAQLEAIRIRIGIKHRLPEVLFNKLTGSTVDEIEADAIALKNALPQASISNDSSSGINTAPPQPSAKEIMESRRSNYRI